MKNFFMQCRRHAYIRQLFEAASEGDEGQKGSDQNDGQSKETDDGKSKDGGKGKDKDSDEKKYSDADLDAILNKKFAKWQKDQEKAVNEAKKLASMSEQEKAEHERDELQKKLDELTRANNLADMGKQARKMLAEDGINIPDDLVNLIITEDAETTKDTVQQFSKLFKTAVQDAVKEALKGQTPGKGSSSGTVTKEQIMAIKDRNERQKMILKHKDLFK